MTTPRDLASLNEAALAELGRVVEGVSHSELETLIEVLVRARRIALHGLGREGLMMRALAMRLFHLGLVCCPINNVQF